MNYRQLASQAPSYVTALVVLGAILFFVLNMPERVSYWLRGPYNIVSFAVPALIIGIGVTVGARWSPRMIWAALGIASLAIIGLQPVAGVLLLTAASLAAGAVVVRAAQIVLRNVRIRITPGSEPLILTIGAGSGLLSGVLWAASHFPVNTAISHTLLYAGICALAVVIISGRTRLGYLRHGRRLAKATSKAPRLALAPIIMMAVILGGLAALPESGTDSVAVYQAYFSFLEANGYWHHDPAIAAWSLQPLGGIHQAGSVYLVGGEQAPRLLNFFWFVGATCAVAQIAGRVSRTHWASWVGAAIITSIPVVLNVTGNFFYDNAAALWITCAVLAIVKSAHNRSADATSVVAFAFCIAGAAATKHTNWIIAPILVLVMLWTLRYSVRHMVLCLTATGLAGAILVIPIIVVAWLKSGNPVFPYYNQYFLSPYRAPEQHATPHQGYLGWDILIRLVFDTRSFTPQDPQGAAGLAPLLLLPAALSLFVTRAARNYALIYAALVGALLLVSSMQNDLRLLLPLLIATLGLSIGLICASADQQTLGRLALLSSFAALVGVQLFFMPTGSWNIPASRLDAVFRSDVRDDWMSLRNPSAAINAALRGLPGADGRRLYLSTRTGLSDALSVTNSWNAFRYRNWLNNARSDEELIALLTELAPDVVVLGTHRSRGWIPERFYGLLHDRADNHLVVHGHQVFLMNTSVAFSSPAIANAPTQTVIDRSVTGTGAVSPDLTRMWFTPAGPKSEGFQLRFSYTCDVTRNLEIVLSARAEGQEVRSRRERLPCMGHEVQGSADVRVPLEGETIDMIIVGVWPEGRDSDHALYNIHAGFKPVLDTRFGYGGPLSNTGTDSQE